jgi:hypothetical protein
LSFCWFGELLLVGWVATISVGVITGVS